MSEDEIIGTFEHWIEYGKANKDKINKADELIEIQQGLLDLYNKEKEENKKLSEKLTEQICNKVEVEVLEEYRLKLKNSISKDKIRDMKRYREFELQQQYKDFENDSEWKTYNKILEEN